MHATPPLAKSPLISSCSGKKCLAKISTSTSQTDLQFIFTPDGWRMYPFNLPVSAPSCSWVAFQLSKHHLSNTLSQHQTLRQNYPRQPREYLKVSKSKRPRSLTEFIPIYLSSLQCDFYILNHLVTTLTITKGRLCTPGKTFFPPEKTSGTYCMHNHCFQCKIWASRRKFFVPHCVPSWLGVCWWLLPCDFHQLCYSVQSFHNQIFQV